MKFPHHFLMEIKRDRRGLSLVFSIIISTVLLVVSAGVSESFLRANDRKQDYFRSQQAEYAARSAQEYAVSLVRNADLLGYEIEETDHNTWMGMGNAVANYQVIARSKGLAWQNATPTPPNGICDPSSPSAPGCFVLPVPGTGTAGGTACNFTKPGLTTQTWDTNVDDDCNWNRLAYGETASIPLYYEDSASACANGFCDPSVTGMNTFILRVRTPGGETLDGTTNVIVNWEISGECDTTGDGVADGTCFMLASPEDQSNSIPNSQLTADFLNTANGNMNVAVEGGTFGNASTNAVPYEVINFIKNAGNDARLLNPYLKLAVITIPTTQNGNTRLPYLEYQLLTNQPIADTKSVYSSRGEATGKMGTYLYPLYAGQAIDSNQLINFVVQN